MKYDLDRDELLKKIKIEGVEKVTLIGASFDESKAEKELSIKYNNLGNDFPYFYHTVGDHPDEIRSYDPDSSEGIEYLSELESLCKDKFGNISAVAIGEIGLDYYGDTKTDETFKHQKKWFIAEMELARKLKLPIVVHSRDACKDTLDIIKENGRDLRGIIHCFGYEKEIALEYIKMGYMIGIGGVVTFKNARKTKETVETIPIDYIVTETDCPYLAPTPHRGERNDSSYIRFVIDEIASLKKVSSESIIETLYDNALKVFNI